MIKTVSILGCGWLGLPLAKELLEKEIEVKGSTTHSEKLELLAEAGIQPFLIRLNPTIEGDSIEDFLESELLIIDIPPRVDKSPDGFHVEQIQELIKRLKNSSVKYIIYVSATSVYPESGKVFIESDVTKLEQAENKILFQAEELIREIKQLQSTIIRCAGLVGDDRNPIKYFAGKSGVKGGNAPVNLIHREDVIGIICEVIANGYWNETLNITSPEHPLRKDFYSYLASRYNYAQPHFEEGDQSLNKIISIDKLQKDLNYTFKFPNPKEFRYTV